MKKAIRFVQIETTANHIYGLTREGEVWYRSVIPYSYSTGYTTPTNVSRKESESKENEKLWKPLDMIARHPDPPGPQLETVPIERSVESESDGETQTVDERPTPTTSVAEARAIPEDKPRIHGGWD